MKIGVDYIGVAVVFLCHDGNGEFVMALRNENTRDEHNRWDIGGGALEFGENELDNLAVEIWQEYKAVIDLDGIQFLGYRNVLRTQNEVPTHWLALDYAVQVDRSTVSIGEPEKFDDLAWYNLSTIPTNVHSQFPTFISQHEALLTNILGRH